MQAFFVKVEKHYKQLSWHDESGFEITWVENPDYPWGFNEWNREDAESMTKQTAELFAAKIDGQPNGSRPEAGIAWSNRVNWQEIENGYRVWLDCPIGD